jgi:Fe-S cluster assembly ATP-binding protein
MLKLKNIFVEAGETQVVQDVSLEVTQGSVAVLMGPNGSGKSSLVNALLGHPHYHITKGTILLNGVDITQMSTEEKAKQGLFLSLQHTPSIGGITLASFLHKAYCAVHQSDVSILEYYAKLVDIAETLGIMRSLLDRPLTDGLSGGEKKQSELLQLVALEPKIAILDEIDSGVDIDALHTVFRVLERMKQNKVGCVVISHHPSLLDHISPDAVHVMSQGRLVRSDGASLAEEILEKGFCAVADCVHAGNCPGACTDTKTPSH